MHRVSLCQQAQIRTNQRVLKCAAHAAHSVQISPVRCSCLKKIIAAPTEIIYSNQCGTLGKTFLRWCRNTEDHFSHLTVALKVQHRLVPLVLDLLAVRGDGKALAAGIKDYHVLVLGICPLVDVEASIQVQHFLGHRRFAAEFFLVLVILQSSRTKLRGRPQNEEPPVH